VRVADLDRDMSDVVPTGLTPDSDFLFARMTELVLGCAGPGPGRRLLDVASGFGQDARALARGGAAVVGAEPSSRMTGVARLLLAESGAARPHWVRSWSDALAFRSGSFDASFCKGALDHFDSPEEAIAEMARVTSPSGRVVLAIANFASLACRLSRWLDDLREGWLGRPVRRGRRGYDVPSDHFTRYDLALMREQAERHLVLESVVGTSLGWGFGPWSRLLRRLPARVSGALLRALDAVARRLPSLADVVILVGRPRQTTDR
jgi:SAM-dependent methyltransferase